MQETQLSLQVPEEMTPLENKSESLIRQTCNCSPHLLWTAVQRIGMPLSSQWCPVPRQNCHLMRYRN